MTFASRQGLSSVRVATGVTLLVFVIGAAALVASYNEAHRPRHSESWDGPLSEMGTCAGPVEDWTRGVREHRTRAREANAQALSAEVGLVTHFLTVVVPWHLEQRPLVPLTIVCCEIAVLIGAFRLRVMDQNHRHVWEHPFFIPEDPFEIMICLRTGDCCELDAIFRVEQVFQVRLNRSGAELRRWMEDGTTFSGIVDLITATSPRYTG